VCEILPPVRGRGAGLLEALNPRFAEAEQIAKDDPRITASYVEYQSPDGYGTLRAYIWRRAHVMEKLPACAGCGMRSRPQPSHRRMY